MDKKQSDFYVKIRKEIADWLTTKSGKDNKWSKYILLAPDLFHLLCKLVIDEDVPNSKKIKVGAVIIYFISPFDLLPEGLLGPIGYLDDITLTAYILNDLLLNIDPKIIKRNWAGDEDILNLIKTVLANSEKLIGNKLWRKIKKMF